MSSTPDSVRLARTSDVDDVSRVQVAAWRAAYTDVLPDPVLASLDTDEIAWEWGRALLQPGPHRLLVAIGREGQVVGAAGVGQEGHRPPHVALGRADELVERPAITAPGGQRQSGQRVVVAHLMHLRG